MALLPQQAGDLDPTVVRQTAAAILEDPAYHRFRREGDLGQIGHLIEQAKSSWRDFLLWSGELADTSPLLYWLLLISLLALLALLIWHMVWSVRRANQFDARRQTERGGIDGPPREKLLRQAAERAAAAGDYTEAVRQLFLLVLHRFGLRHPGQLRRGWTNRECLQIFHDRQQQQEELLQVVEALDQKWYGGRPCSAEEFQTLRQRCEDLIGAV